MAFDPRTKEERKLFPFWTLIVIAGCAALWVFGAKFYQESMAAYQSYAAITQNVAQNTYYPGVTVDGVDLGGMTREEAGALFGSRQQETQQRVFAGRSGGRAQMAHHLRRGADDV